MEIKKRHLKNLGLLGENGQRKLFASHAAIVGAGGLGGAVFEILARCGVGKITITDFDDFEESNLNRQILSTVKNLGTNKAIAAAERGHSINPDVEVIASALKLTEENAAALLGGADVICDCLGNIPDRFVLERAARKLKIPLVHAALAGSRGQLMTIYPGDKGLAAIYGGENDAPKSGEELSLGTPPSMVVALASMQAHEAISVLTGIQPPLRNTLLTVDVGNWKIMKLKI